MSAPEVPAPAATPGPVEASASPDAGRQLALLLTLQFSFGIAFSTFVLLPKILAASLHAGPAAIGRVMAMFAYAGLAAALLTGERAERHGRPRLIIEGTALMIVSALGYLAVDRIGPLAMVLRAAHGAVASLVAGVLATRLVDGGPAGPASGGGSILAVLRRGRAQRLTLAIGLAGVALSAMFSFSQLMALSLGIRHVSGFFVAYTAAVIVVRVALGGLIDRVGPQRASVGALVLYTVVVFSMRYLDVLGLSALGAAFGVAHGFLFPSVMALSVVDLPAAERGRMLRLANAGFIGGGAFVGPLGTLAARAGYPALYTLCAAGALAAAALLWRWPISGPRAVP